MVERDPDFEDEKIRLWRTPKEKPPPYDAGDETVMAVDLGREEVYESRVYPLLPHPVTIAFVAAWLARQEEPPPQDEFLLLVQSAIGESLLKVLAKRDRSDGRISYLVVAVGPELRVLIERGEAADEEKYRRMVAHLEDELVVPGVVGEPQVTTPEEWRQYELPDQ